MPEHFKKYVIMLAFCVTALVPCMSDASSGRTAGSIPVGKSAASSVDKAVNVDTSVDVVTEVNFKKLESLGIKSTIAKGSIGRDVWHSMKRSNIISALEALSPDIGSRTVTKLSIRTLLSSNDASLITNDVEPEPGKDLFSLRIKKLLEFGLFEEAVEMYALLRDDAYHPDLAKSGVLAMLGNGELSLACLESRAFEERFSALEFWQDMNEFCSFILKDAEDGEAKPKIDDLSDNPVIKKIVSNPDFTVSYNSPDVFKRYDTLGVTALFAAKRVRYTELGKVRITKIPSRDIGLMLADSSLPENYHFPLVVESVRRGLKDADAIDPFFPRPRRGKSDTTSSPEDFGNWRDLPEIYKVAVNSPKGNERWKWLSQAVEVTPYSKWPSLFPFVRMINDSSPPSDISAESSKKILSLLLYADQKPDHKWKKLFSDFSESREKNISSSDSLISIASDIMNNSANLHSLTEENSVNLKDFQIELVIQLMKALDISYVNRVETGMPYEKGKGLTFSKDYVMPSVILLDFLDRSTNDKLLGGEILFSAIVLEKAAPSDLYPGVVHRLVKGLGTVGQRTASRELATEAVLGLIN